MAKAIITTKSGDKTVLVTLANNEGGADLDFYVSYDVEKHGDQVSQASNTRRQNDTNTLILRTLRGAYGNSREYDEDREDGTYRTVESLPVAFHGIEEGTGNRVFIASGDVLSVRVED